MALDAEAKDIQGLVPCPKCWSVVWNEKLAKLGDHILGVFKHLQSR
jgi:hypothetical protein